MFVLRWYHQFMIYPSLAKYLITGSECYLNMMSLFSTALSQKWNVENALLSAFYYSITTYGNRISVHLAFFKMKQWVKLITNRYMAQILNNIYTQIERYNSCEKPQNNPNKTCTQTVYVLFFMSVFLLHYTKKFKNNILNDDYFNWKKHDKSLKIFCQRLPKLINVDIWTKNFNLILGRLVWVIKNEYFGNSTALYRKLNHYMRRYKNI
eukprot:99236_1